MPSAELDEFVATVLARQIEAERALHDGDPLPRSSTWSHQDPVTLFGAAVPCTSGWDDVSAVFRWLGATFAGCHHYDFELIAGGVSGDIAYTVGYERYRAATAAGDTVDNTLRVTHVYRREHGHWKIVHRHGDHVPTGQRAPA